jgi:DGQHR domain-containing protein
MTTPTSGPALILQDKPRIYMTALDGRWLLQHSTPSWRIDDPEKGFQRVVKEARAKAIAVAVLDQQRTFPNAIILATNRSDFDLQGGTLSLPKTTKLLVVDGQHRLWAQKYSVYQATYGCMIHTGLAEVAMAQLFLEINDNQKRVPSSLRWDLVRLVRPEDDPQAIKAAELVFELAMNEESPLYQRVDLTGENGRIVLKQGSIAPELKTLISSKTLKELQFDETFDLLVRYLSAIRSLDNDGWREGTTPALAAARVLRVLLRLLPMIVEDVKKPAVKCREGDFHPRLSRINLSSLEPANIRAVQGSAGMKEIFQQVVSQVFPDSR